MLLLSFDVTLCSLRMPPVGTLEVSPPLKMIVQWDFVIGRGEDDGPRDQIFGWRTGKFFLRRCPLRDRDITGRVDEFLELLVRHHGRIHPEAVDKDTVDRPCVV